MKTLCATILLVLAVGISCIEAATLSTTPVHQLDFSSATCASASCTCGALSGYVSTGSATVSTTGTVYCSNGYVTAPDVDGSESYLTVNTASFTKPHIFFTVRLNAIDIADDTNAIFFRAPAATNANNIGSYCHSSWHGSTCTSGWRSNTFPITATDHTGGLLVSAPSLVSTSVGWSDWIVIEYGYDGSGQGVLTTNGLDAKTGTGPSTFTNYRWGNSPYDDNHRTRTDLGEMLIYDVNSQYLTSSQRQNVVQYLQDKWNACDASTAPTNGGVGSCTNSLASGSTCQPTCNSGYTVSGTSSCSAGTLTAAMCLRSVSIGGHTVYEDADGWLLLLSYNHIAGESAYLVPSTAPAPTEAAYSHIWLNDLGVDVNKVESVRFFCKTTNHNRVIHFATENDWVKRTLRDGSTIGNLVSYWQTEITKFDDHTAYLPDLISAASHPVENNLTQQPFWKGAAYHWNVRLDHNVGGTPAIRFECDDHVGNTHSTVHQIWFKPNPCDASTAPTNGGVGSCTNSLASGSTCQPTCNSGYTVSGTSSCSAGTLTAATCSANPCDASTAPTNGGVGSCTNSLASGSTCQPTCNSGYTVSGTSSCSAGTLTAATCSANPCDASTAPTNGGVGSCTNSLASGSTCQPTCNSGYTVSGTSSCSAGTLTAATCDVPSPSPPPPSPLPPLPPSPPPPPPPSPPPPSQSQSPPLSPPSSSPPSSSPPPQVAASAASSPSVAPSSQAPSPASRPRALVVLAITAVLVAA